MQSNSKTADLTRTRKGVREGYGYKAYQKTGKILPPAQGNARISLIIFRGAVDSDNGFSENIFQYCLMNTWLCHEGAVCKQPSIRSLRRAALASAAWTAHQKRRLRGRDGSACGAGGAGISRKQVQSRGGDSRSLPACPERRAGFKGPVRAGWRTRAAAPAFAGAGKGAVARGFGQAAPAKRPQTALHSGGSPTAVTPCPRLLRRVEYHPRCGLPPGTALRGLKD